MPFFASKLNCHHADHWCRKINTLMVLRCTPQTYNINCCYYGRTNGHHEPYIPQQSEDKIKH